MALVSDLYKDLINWYARKDNPNQVTAAQVESYTKGEYDNQVSLMTPRGVLPVAYFGDCTEQRSAQVAYSMAGSTFTHSALPVMLSGNDYTLAAETVDIAALTTDWKSKTGYLFIKESSGGVSWVYSPTRGSDSGNVIRVGTVVCDATKITSLTLSKVFILGDTRYMG